MARKLLDNARFFNRTDDIVRDDNGEVLGFRERTGEAVGRFNLVPVNKEGLSISTRFIEDVSTDESALEAIAGFSFSVDPRTGSGYARASMMQKALEDAKRETSSAFYKSPLNGVSSFNKPGGIGVESARFVVPFARQLASSVSGRLDRLRGMGFTLVEPSSTVPVFASGVGLQDKVFDLSRADPEALRTNDPFIGERIDIESELEQLRAERDQRMQRRRDVNNPTGQRALLSDQSRNQGRNLLSA